MASQATRIPPSLPQPHRKPLHPRNFRANQTVPAINSKKPNLAIVERAEKENLEISGSDEKMKLLEFAMLEKQIEGMRLRTERLRLGRESWDTKMREIDAVFERLLIGAERRLHELVVLEIEIERLVRAKVQRDSFLKSSAYKSLRAREQKKR